MGVTTVVLTYVTKNFVENSTNSTLTACVAADVGTVANPALSSGFSPVSTNPNQPSGCYGASGTFIIKKPSGNSFNGVLGGTLCLQKGGTLTVPAVGVWHLAYSVTGGTAPFSNAPGPAGSGFLDMDFNQVTANSLTAATSKAVVIQGTIVPGTNS
jgi:hypothetical protein